jgi:hypothetical protein
MEFLVLVLLVLFMLHVGEEELERGIEALECLGACFSVFPGEFERYDGVAVSA